jgi:hypothetical protein
MVLVLLGISFRLRRLIIVRVFFVEKFLIQRPTEWRSRSCLRDVKFFAKVLTKLASQCGCSGSKYINFKNINMTTLNIVCRIRTFIFLIFVFITTIFE